MRPEIEAALRDVWANIDGLIAAEVDLEPGVTPELVTALAGAHSELNKLFGGN
jgi:hypothetical protein